MAHLTAHINPLTNTIGGHHEEHMIRNETIMVNQLSVHHNLSTATHLPPLYSTPQIGDDYHSSSSTSLNDGANKEVAHVGPTEKKRKISESPKGTINVKPEPISDINRVAGSMEDEYGFDYNSGADGPSSVYLDSAYQCIRFQPFQQTGWHILCDSMSKEL